MLNASRASRDSLLQALSINTIKKRNLNSSFVRLCKFVTDYRTRENFVSTIAAEEMKNATRFKEDFLKVVEFVHYLQEEGYDMITFDKVCNADKS